MCCVLSSSGQRRTWDYITRSLFGCPLAHAYALTCNILLTFLCPCISRPRCAPLGAALCWPAPPLAAAPAAARRAPRLAAAARAAIPAGCTCPRRTRPQTDQPGQGPRAQLCSGYGEKGPACWSACVPSNVCVTLRRSRLVESWAGSRLVTD
jgi:hypothetical protein